MQKRRFTCNISKGLYGQQEVAMKQSTIIENKAKYDSYFDNTVVHTAIHHVKLIVLGIVTLGLAYPWLLCSKYEAKYKHTVVCGKRLKFIGDPKELIAHWVLWWFLMIITFGLYGIVVKVRFEQWIAANTVFEEVHAQECAALDAPTTSSEDNTNAPLALE